MSVAGRAVATIAAIRGETVIWGLRATPVFAGNETVTCAVKLAVNGSFVPAADAPIVHAVTPAFVAAAGDVAAHWLFTLSPAQTAAMESGVYITDARIEAPGGAVDYAAPLAISLGGGVTPWP